MPTELKYADRASKEMVKRAGAKNRDRVGPLRGHAAAMQIREPGNLLPDLFHGPMPA